MSRKDWTARQKIERAFHVSFMLPEQAKELLDEYRDEVRREILTESQREGKVEDMGRHGKPEEGYNAVTNPTGTGGDGSGPIEDEYTNQALVDAWNIDAAYEKATKKKDEE